MNSDCGFEIGSTHRVCQDYAIAGQDKDVYYAIIADGCSSSPDTDIGARFLVKAAETFLYQIQLNDNTRTSLERYHQQSVQFAALSSKFLKLDPSCLDATLLTIKASPSAIVLSCYGDGVIALGRANGSIDVYSIEFVDGFPQYVSYTLDALRRQGFDAQTSNEKKVTHHILTGNGNACNVETSTDVIQFYFARPMGYRFAAIMSDGVHSFFRPDDTDTGNEPIAMPDIVSLLLDFKFLRGDFVHRRMKSFQTICASRSWHHKDDISLGVIALD